MLHVDAIFSGYTQVDVLQGLSLQVPDGGFVGVLGPNGAGKTALMRAISGLNPLRAGSIRFNDMNLGQSSPSDIVKAGVIQVPQGRLLFGPMSVRENLELGAFFADRFAFCFRSVASRARAVPHPSRKTTPACCIPVGRGAANVGHCPRADEQAQTLAVGRAFIGFGAQSL